MPVYLDCETTSLDGDIGMLVAVGLLLPDKEEVLFVENPNEEKKTIEKLVNLLENYRSEEVYIWNARFDIPFLLTRAIIHGIDASILLEIKVVDLCEFCRENLKLSSNKLDEVSKFFCLDKNLKITGKNIQELYIQFLNGKTENKEKIIAHCLDDLYRLKELHEKLQKYVEIWKQKK